MASAARSVLCVDDEPRVLDGLRLTLRRGFDVSTATSGAEGLSILRQRAGVAVVISDMRMPGMDGAAFLAKVREQWPDSTRLLLTGEPGRDDAVSVVNAVDVFRFLTKPCSPEHLITAVEAGIRQHELVTGEKILLQQTVLGSIHALVDVLAIVRPAAFGRSVRIRRLASELATASELPSSWELEAAALLSQVGYLSLPTELVEKAVCGEPLDADEKRVLADVPAVTQGLLARIPRLENVAAILACATDHPPSADTPASAEIAVNGTVLMVALEFDALTSRGESTSTAIATLQARWGASKLLGHLAALQNAWDFGGRLQEIRLGDVTPGMILLDDLRTHRGALLVSRGYEVSQSFVDRMRHFDQRLLGERVRVRLSHPMTPAPP